MRVLVCGSRDWDDGRSNERALSTLDADDVVIHGAARGADSIAASCASDRGLEVVAFPADWDRHGRGAGFIRNRKMLEEGKPDVVWAFKSRAVSVGTDSMLRIARAAGVPTFVVTR